MAKKSSSKKSKHIKIKNNKISFASEELKLTLTAFYFAYYANGIMKFVNKNFLSNIIDVTTKNLEELGLSWNDIPEDGHKWGVVLDYINNIKKENNNELLKGGVGAVKGVK